MLTLLYVASGFDFWELDPDVDSEVISLGELWPIATNPHEKIGMGFIFESWDDPGCIVNHSILDMYYEGIPWPSKWIKLTEKLTENYYMKNPLRCFHIGTWVTKSKLHIRCRSKVPLFNMYKFAMDLLYFLYFKLQGPSFTRAL